MAARILGCFLVVVTALLPSPATATGLPDTNRPLDQESEVAALEKSARAAGALGFFTDSDGVFVVVVPTELAGALTLPAELASGLAVRVKAAPIRASDISGAKSKLASLRSDPGTGALEFWFDPSTAKVVARGTSNPDRVLPLLGDAAAFVDYTMAEPPVRFSRHSDTPDFWGGAETQRVGLGGFQCTTGFTVKKSNGNRFLALAGHCFLNMGTVVISPGNSLTQGKIVQIAPYPQFDMELIGSKTYGPDIYVGGAAGAGMFVKGASDPVEGRPIYCHSGAATFQQCNHTVVDLHGGTACDQNGLNCTHDLMIVSEGDKGPCSQDSGAPFFLISGGNAYIRGMVIGGNALCFGNSVAHRWTTISTQLSVSIVIA